MSMSCILIRSLLVCFVQEEMTKSRSDLVVVVVNFRVFRAAPGSRGIDKD